MKIKRVWKIVLFSIVGVLVVVGVVFALGNGEMLAGRLSRGILPAYNADSVKKPVRDSKILPAYDQNQYKEYFSVEHDCEDNKDNDKDGLFDCFDPDCAVTYPNGFTKCGLEQASKLYDAVPGTYVLHSYDRFKFNNGMIVEVNNLSWTEYEDEPVVFSLYYEIDNEIVMFPEPYLYVRDITAGDYPKTFDCEGCMAMYEMPFLTLNGVYLYLHDVDIANDTATVEIFDNCTDVYNECMNEPKLANYQERCKQLACPYEAFTSDYEVQEKGDVKIVYPKADKEYADLLMKYLPGCYEATNDLIGKSQPFDQITVYFYNGKPEANLPSGGYEKDRVFVMYNDTLESVLPFPIDNYDVGGVCGAMFLPLAHELAHSTHFGMMIPGQLTEGFANYISGKVLGENSIACPLTCAEEGYQYDCMYYEEGDYESYEGGGYYVWGECFWRMLEDEYGWNKVKKVIDRMVELRNKLGEYDFFKDIITPTLGADAKDKILEIANTINPNLDVDCNSQFYKAWTLGGCK